MVDMTTQADETDETDSFATNDRGAPATIAVLGLGAMGAAIARAAAERGQRVLAWNRTPKTLDELGLAKATGIVLIESPSETLNGVDLVVVCVRDHAGSRAVIEQIAPALGGRVVVNVSTGTPAEAVGSAAHAAARGVRYVTGAVMVPTPMVGTDDCVVLYAGAEDDLAETGPLFAAMRGTNDVVGEDHAVPPALDLAMLDIYFAGMYAHLHATALAAAHGVDAARFLPYARGIVDTLGASLAGLTASVEQRRYDGGEARLDMCLSFLEHIVATSRAAGIDPGPAEIVRAASARAMQHWPGSTDWDVVAEGFLPHSGPQPS